MEIEYTVSPRIIEVVLKNYGNGKCKNIEVKIGGNKYTYFESFLLKNNIPPSHYLGEFPMEIEGGEKASIFRYISNKKNFSEYLQIIKLLKENKIEVSWNEEIFKGKNMRMKISKKLLKLKPLSKL